MHSTVWIIRISCDIRGGSRWRLGVVATGDCCGATPVSLSLCACFTELYQNGLVCCTTLSEWFGLRLEHNWQIRQRLPGGAWAAHSLMEFGGIFPLSRWPWVCRPPARTGTVSLVMSPMKLTQQRTRVLELLTLVIYPDTKSNVPEAYPGAFPPPSLCWGHFSAQLAKYL